MDVTQLRSLDPEALRLALEALADEEADHTETFLAFLTHTHPRVREAAVWGLLSGDLERACQPLITLVEQDSKEEVQAAAVFVLGRFVYEGQMLEDETTSAPLEKLCQQVEALLRRLVREPQQKHLLQRRALETLSFLEDAEIEATIELWSKSPDEFFRKSAAFAMGRANAERFSKHLLKSLEDPSRMVRLESIRSVGEQGLRRGVSRLAAVGKGDDLEMALEAIQALGQVGGKQAETALKDLARLRDKERAAAAKDALAELNGEA